MSTVSKTWAFPTDLMGFVDVGLSAVSITYDASPQAAEILGAATGTNEKFRTATSVNWEAWGVPSGGTVTDVQITDFKSRRWSNPIVSTTIALRIVDSSGVSVHSAGDLHSVALLTGSDGSFVSNGAGTSRTVDSGKQASTTNVRLEIEATLTAANASVDIGLDDIALTITYTAGGTDATVTAVVADGVGDLPDPTVTAGSTVTSPPDDGTGTLPAPVVSGGSNATVTPPASDGTGDLPDPAVSAGATVAAPPVDGTGTLPPVNAVISGEVTTGPASGTGTMPPPAVSGGSSAVDVTVTAVPVDGTGDVPDPTVSAGASVTSPADDGTGTVPAPAVAAGATVTSPSADATGTLPAPTVSGTSAGQVAAVPAAGAGTMPAPTVTAGGSATAPAADGTGTLPAPAVAAGATVTGTPASGTGDLPDPAVTAGGSSTVAAPVLDATGDMPAPVVTEYVPVIYPAIPAGHIERAEIGHVEREGVLVAA